MPAASLITVVIAEFEDLVSHGLRAVIAQDDQITVVADRVPHGAVADAVARHAPRVAILNFGSLRSPVDLHELHARFPGTRLVILANHPSPAECDQLLAFGATACLSKETPARDILHAVHLASRGLHVLPRPARPPRLGEPPGPDLLTAREADVLELLQEGRSNGEIAAALHVGVETVRTHARHIYRKLGVRTRRELAALAAARDGAPPATPPRAPETAAGRAPAAARPPAPH